MVDSIGNVGVGDVGNDGDVVMVVKFLPTDR